MKMEVFIIKDYELSMKCKDFDSWTSFLGRLAKIGSDYIIKNDIILAVHKGTDKKTGDRIPGKHIVRDPLALDDYDFQEFCIEDSIFVMQDIQELLKTSQMIQERDKSARKSILYFRNKSQIGLTLGNHEVIIANVFDENLSKKIEEVDKGALNAIIATANSIGWFVDLIDPIENAANNKWIPFTKENLTHLRNDGVFRVSSMIDGVVASSKLTRSLFYMAGVTRTDTPIAESASYAFLPSEQSDVAILRIYAKYKCGQSTMTMLNCVHEYLSLVYDDGKGLGEQ